MFKNKLLRIGSVGIMSLGLLSISASALVACGHKKHTPSKYNWTTFLAAAKKASAAEIVAPNKTAIGWGDVPNAQLVKQKEPIITDHNIVVQIYANPIWEIASFSISAPVDYQYDANSWTCSIYPRLVPNGTWDQFKYLATKVSPNDLLKTAKVAKNYASFKWVGKADTNVWQKDQVAEFDTYGGDGTTKVDPVDIMQGAPKIDEANKTISAIISIKDKTKEGTCYSNPIKAVIKYNNGNNYNLNQWVFSKIKQLQSFVRWTTMWQAGDKAAHTVQFSTFIKRYWTDSSHSMNTFIWFWIHWDNHGAIASYSRRGSGWDWNTKNGTTYEIWFWITTNTGPLPTHSELHLRFNFMYNDISNHNIGTAFNYVFVTNGALVYPLIS